jgi:hypothetical protein
MTENGLFSNQSRSDCEIIKEDFEGVVSQLGECVETVADEYKGKGAVVGSMLGVLGATTKLLWHGTGCAIRHTPRALAAAAAVKREIAEAITEELKKAERERREREIMKRIESLKKKSEK